MRGIQSAGTAICGTDLRINGDRLCRRLEELAQVGRIAGDGVCRLALSDEDREGRNLVADWMRDLGLAVKIDAIGNVVGVRAGLEDGPPVMTGSHIDTVRTGGRYDGTLGVLAGLEVIATLNDAEITTKRPLAVAFFTNEEGSRFQPDMFGSLVYTGQLSLAEALATKGIDGATAGDELARIGYAGPEPVGRPHAHSYVELHVEQGPVLEAEGSASARSRASRAFRGANSRSPASRTTPEPRRCACARTPAAMSPPRSPYARAK